MYDYRKKIEKTDIKLVNNVIEQVDNFNYLGSYVTKERFQKH